MTERYLRWRFVVDWKLQGVLILQGLLYGGLVLVTVCGGILWPLMADLGSAAAAEVDSEHALVMIYMHDRLWLLASLCFAIVVLGTLRFSHRIAGPLVRYKRHLRMLAQGTLPPPLRTRRQDCLKEEVECLNQAVAGIANHLAAIRQAHAAVVQEVDAVMARTPRQSVASYEPLLAACSELQARLAVFEPAETGHEGPRTRDAAEPRPVLAGSAAAGEG
jgi:hypothetical protein